MKRILTLMVACLVVYGCAGSPSRREADNTKSMLQLRPEMTVEQVQNVMTPPDRTEMYRGKNKEVVLTYFYLTNSMGYVKNPSDEANYTPLIFIDNKLNGWGWDHLKSSANKYEFVIKHR